MNVCFKRIKKIAEVSLSELSRKWEIWFSFSVTFLCVNFTTINQSVLNTLEKGGYDLSASLIRKDNLIDWSLKHNLSTDN